MDTVRGLLGPYDSPTQYIFSSESSSDEDKLRADYAFLFLFPEV